jgi:cytochrome c biogenesis protein CcmG, thiol:disulfide interchange protein DsbE
MSRRLLVYLPLLIFGGLAALFLAGLYGGEKSTIPSAMIGRAAPEVSFPALDGLQRGGTALPGLEPAMLRDGTVTLVNVFASWCAPCHAEHPLLMELAKDNRIRIAGINHKDTPENARRFLASKGNPYRMVGVDANGRGSIEWGVYGLPESFIVRRDGTIAHKLVGPLTEQNLVVFRAEIEKALK